MRHTAVYAVYLVNCGNDVSFKTHILTKHHRIMNCLFDHIDNKTINSHYLPIVATFAFLVENNFV